jgi:hypothetical protein
VTNWCILRTAPSRTLLLAAALTDAGYRAWTPQESRQRRVGRQRERKSVSAPMVPTIVFAEYERLPMLVALSRQPSPTCTVWDDTMKCHVQRALPGFTVFRHLDMYPRIADRALDALRLAEQRGRPRDQARAFCVGDHVKYADAGFEGLVGEVVRVRGRRTWVLFAGHPYLAEIPATSLLPMREAA